MTVLPNGDYSATEILNKLSLSGWLFKIYSSHDEETDKVFRTILWNKSGVLLYHQNGIGHAVALTITDVWNDGFQLPKLNFLKHIDFKDIDMFIEPINFQRQYLLS